ncbi:hypothetical protein ACJJI3_10380 [Microbulbifer sp. ZKSA004]|uniref:hypothetical protein n=1 Tax=Microbulbifer sp. ZKSA004 TaxID=3243389 RepID=UPI0040398EB1
MRFIATLLLLAFSETVWSEENKNEYDLAPLCNQLYKIATSALIHKEKGMTKEQLLAPLPDLTTLIMMPFSKQKHLAQNMHRIADEIYTFEDLEVRSYSAFTAESCHRQLQGLHVPGSFEVAYPKLLECNKLPTPQERIDCGMVVSGSTVKPQKSAPKSGSR